ncbi:MAG TPA: hypothetical protein VJ723_10800 [Candidatus Angelobacter sp.]|nr:hypothetical protein [Candidatus Angelobacter sp.]
MLKNSVTAFLDILGFAAEMKASFEDGTAANLLVRLRSGLSGAYKAFSDDMWGGPIEIKTWEVKAFTDNIVIGYPIYLNEPDAEAELGSVLLSVREYQLKMVDAGFFVRGRISIGQLYMDNEIVFGNALIEAYTAESTLARDPRIVLAKSVQPYFEQHLKYYGSPAQSPHNRVLLRDVDGQIFVNYLGVIFDDDPDDPRLDELAKHKSAIEERLQKHKNEPPIWSKYAWSANYHNFICHEQGGRLSRYVIEPDLLRAHPTRLFSLADSLTDE